MQPIINIHMYVRRRLETGLEYWRPVYSNPSRANWRVRVSIKILTPRSKFHEWKSEIENLEKGWIIEGGRSHLAYLAVSSI